jgi:hypothetical protein
VKHPCSAERSLGAVAVKGRICRRYRGGRTSGRILRIGYFLQDASRAAWTRRRRHVRPIADLPVAEGDRSVDRRTAGRCLRSFGGRAAAGDRRVGASSARAQPAFDVPHWPDAHCAARLTRGRSGPADRTRASRRTTRQQPTRSKSSAHPRRPRPKHRRISFSAPFTTCSFLQPKRGAGKGAEARQVDRTPLQTITNRYTVVPWMVDKRLTAFRLDDEDRAILAKLRKLTGLDSAAAIVRLAIREALASREAKRGKR